MPYMGVQLISNTMLLLLKLGILPMCKFEDWEAVQNKTWPLLKTFVHSAYARKLVANNLRNTTGQLGYVQLTHNIYNMLETDESSNNVTTIMQRQPPPQAAHWAARIKPPHLMCLMNWQWQSTHLQLINNCCSSTLPCWHSTWPWCCSKSGSQRNHPNQLFMLR